MEQVLVWRGWDAEESAAIFPGSPSEDILSLTTGTSDPGPRLSPDLVLSLTYDPEPIPTLTLNPGPRLTLSLIPD